MQNNESNTNEKLNSEAASAQGPAAHVDFNDIKTVDIKKRTPMKRSTMVAVGTSITVVLLAIIITIVVIAVQISYVMTTVFFTNFGYVDSFSRNNMFVASVGGEYSLFEGDRLVSGKYSSLTWNSSLNGYTYTKSDGSSGALRYDGSELYSVKATDTDYAMAKVRGFTPQSATYIINQQYLTIDFATKQPVTQLGGFDSSSAKGGNYFVSGDGSYATLTRQADKRIGALVGSSATFESLDTATANRIVKSTGNAAIVELSNNHVIFGEGLETHFGRYYSVQVGKAKSMGNIYVIGGRVYNSDLTFSGIKDTSEMVYSYAGNVQIGDSIYEIKDGKLVLKKENAKLYKSNKDNDYYYIADGKLFSGAGKELYTALTPNDFEYLGKNIVRDGSIAATIDGKKTLSGVADYQIMDDDIVFFLSDGSISTINATIVSAENAKKIGAGSVNSNPSILESVAGYIVRGSSGVYLSEDIILRDLVYTGGIHFIRAGDFIDKVVAIVDDQIEIYSVSKNKAEIIGFYYYENPQVVQSNKYGIVFSVTSDNVNNKGFIDTSGKLVAPQFSNVILQAEYSLVQLGGTVYAVAGTNGKLLTSFNYVAVSPYGEYIAVVKSNLEVCLINTSGKELYNGITDLKNMTSLTYSDGYWSPASDYGYTYFLSSKGYKVMKYDSNLIINPLP